MSIIKDEFALALNQVANERGISPDEVVQSIEAAVAAAYNKEYPAVNIESITAKINRTNGETRIFENDIDITPPGFGRIAAQTAKQVILQKIREAEKKTVITHYQGILQTVVRGRIIRYDGHNAYLDVGKAEAILPKEEQMRNEKYTVNMSLVVFLKEITPDKFGNMRVVVSRSNPGLIEELFKREVPEIANGTVTIKKVVREAGERAKIAVSSTQSGVDPVGACVGQKGVRVQTVTDELGGQEKIDIIQWNADEKIFLTAALSPAKITEVHLDKERRRAKVMVDSTQAALAIGKGGINVDLASKLTNYIIDIEEIHTESPVAVVEEPKKEDPSTESPTPTDVEPATPSEEVTEEKTEEKVA